MSKRGRPRQTNGIVFERAGSAYWWARYRDREGRIRKESTGTADSGGGGAFPPGPPGRSRRGDLAFRSGRQEPDFQRVGGLVSGAALETAISRGQDTRGEFERSEVLAARFRVAALIRDHAGRY